MLIVAALGAVGTVGVPLLQFVATRWQQKQRDDREDFLSDKSRQREKISGFANEGQEILTQMRGHVLKIPPLLQNGDDAYLGPNDDTSSIITLSNDENIWYGTTREVLFRIGDLYAVIDASKDRTSNLNKAIEMTESHHYRFTETSVKNRNHQNPHFSESHAQTTKALEAVHEDVREVVATLRRKS
ncbi:MAG: hypothetical protein ACTH31_13235 [Pseudoclavibacter sp.]